jgi:4-hydroxy-2-oxoheptanedioate aldolase
MKEFSFKQQIREGKPLLGTWVEICSPESAEMAGAAGFDFLVIDTEHGFFDIGAAENLIRAADAAGIIPFVRVARKEPHLIEKALDAGAEGTIYPGVSRPEEAREAAAATRYPPEGERGACPFIRPAGHRAQDWGEFARRSNEGAVNVLLVEGSEGVNRFSEIVAVPGVDAVMLGPFDLSVALGVPGEVEHPKVMEAFSRMIHTAGEQGVAVLPNVFAPEPAKAGELAAHWRSAGAAAVVVGTDKMLLADAFRRYREACAVE